MKMKAKLALINDTVIDINENYVIVGMDGKYAYYADGKLSEYEYSYVNRLTEHITCLILDNANDAIILDREGHIRCRFREVIQNNDSREYLKDLQKKFSVEELLDGLKNSRNNYGYYGVGLSKSNDKGNISLKFNIGFREYYALIDSKTLEWILPLDGAYVSISSEKLGYRVVAKMGVSRASQYQLVTSDGKIKFEAREQLKRLDKKGMLYEYSDRLIGSDAGCGILKVNSDGSLTEIFKSYALNNRYYNDNFIVVSACENNNSIGYHHSVYNIINSNGERVFEHDIISIEQEKVDDLVCAYTKNGKKYYAVITPDNNKIKTFDDTVRFTRVAFKALKITYPDGKVSFYNEGKECTSMSFSYVCAKKLVTPMCDEVFFGAMTTSMEWYVTDMYGEPIDIEPYNSFEEIQDEFKNKISRPLDRKIYSRKVF